MKDMSDMKAQGEAQTASAVPGGHDMSTMGAMGGMEANTTQPRLSTASLVVVSLLSMAMLAGGLALAARYGDLSMRAGQGSMKTMNMPVANDTESANVAPMNSKPRSDDMKGMKMP